MPGTGKTTLVQEFMKGKEWKVGKHDKLLSYHYNEKDNIYVLGVYEEGKGYAQGTDRLSMAVQADASSFFQNVDADAKILFEGDRLFTASMLEEIMQGHSLQIILLKAENLEERYALRNSNQSEKFLKGRKTKYSNISTNFLLLPYIDILENNNVVQRTKIVESLDNFFCKRK